MAPRKKNKNVININNSNVKLREVANAWKPTRLRLLNANDGEDKTSEQLYGKVRSILNKLTPNNLMVLLQQFHSLDIDSQEKLEGIVELVLEKAIDEPMFSETYAQFCIQVRVAEKVRNSYEETEDVLFSKLIINRCQVMFDNLDSEENDIILEYEKEINECTDPEKKKKLSIALEEEKRQLRIRVVSDMKFIGEFFKLGSLSNENVTMYINHILDHPNEVKLECLCKLLTTIGDTLECKNKLDLSEYFEKIKKLLTENADNISNRIRFMLMDLIELRERQWVPRIEIEFKFDKANANMGRRMAKIKAREIPDQKRIFRPEEHDMLVMTSTGETINKHRSNISNDLKRIQKTLEHCGFGNKMWFMLVDNVPETSTVIELDSILNYYPTECSLKNEVKFNCRDVYCQLVKLIKHNKNSIKNISIWTMKKVGREVKTPIFAQIFVLAIFESCSEVNENNCKVMKNTFVNMLEFIQQYVNKDTDSQERCQKAVQEHMFNAKPKSIPDLFYQIYYKLQANCSWDEVATILSNIL